MPDDTYRMDSITPDAYGGSKTGPFWVETDGHSFTELHITDQMDSVSFETRAGTLGSYAPTIQTFADTRITYDDLVKLIHHLSGILGRHGHQITIGKERT